MTRQEKAVAIARDVLKLIRTRNIRVLDSNTYINTGFIGKIEMDKQLQKSLKKLKNCEVCALGACMLAKVDLFNKCKINEVLTQVQNWDSTPSNRFLVHSRSDVADQLSSMFSEEQLDLIEAAFECNDSNARSSNKKSYIPDYQLTDFGVKCQQAVKFGEQYPEPKERLRAIMKNIIKNDGVFKQDQVKKEELVA